MRSGSASCRTSTASSEGAGSNGRRTGSRAPALLNAMANLSRQKLGDYKAAAGYYELLITNYPDHQAKAIAVGAEPGFGKATLHEPETRTRLAKFLDGPLQYALPLHFRQIQDSPGRIQETVV